MNDAAECLRLLMDQKDCLKRLLADVEGQMDHVRHGKADLALFFSIHGWNVYEMVKGAVLLMGAEEPHATALLARSALESAFIMSAAEANPAFAGQKITQELDELADKIEFFTKVGCWHPSRKPTPDDCRKAAERVLTKYKVVRKKWKQIEQIASIAGLTPYYDDDYRFLSLLVHGNQFGIMNSATGFLTRKGLLALSNGVFFASTILSRVFRLKAKFETEITEHQSRVEAMMRKPELLPGLDDFEGSADDKDQRPRMR